MHMIGLLGRHYSEFEKILLRRHNLEKVIALGSCLKPTTEEEFHSEPIDTFEKADSSFSEVKELVDMLINAYDAQLFTPRVMLGTGYVEPDSKEDSPLDLLTKKAKRMGGSAVDTIRKDALELGASAINSMLMQKTVLKRTDPRITGAMVAFQFYKSTKHNERINGEQRSYLLYLKQNPLPLFRLQSAIHYGTFVQDAFAERLTLIGQNNPFKKALVGVQAGISNSLAYALDFDEAYKKTTESFLYIHVKKVEDFLRYKHKELSPELEERANKLGSSLWSTYRDRKLYAPSAESMLTTVALLSSMKHRHGIFKDLVRGKYDVLHDF